MCKGYNDWTANIVGLEQIAPGETGIHWKTYQETTWTDGPGVQGGCWPGTITKWQEDYWLTDQLPWNNTVAKALKRSKGGNLNGADNWDIWFDKWQLLPWITPTPIPTLTPTSTPVPTLTPTPTPRKGGGHKK